MRTRYERHEHVQLSVLAPMSHAVPSQVYQDGHGELGLQQGPWSPPRFFLVIKHARRGDNTTAALRDENSLPVV